MGDAGLVFFGWVGGQYWLSMLVFTGNVAGLVFKYLYPIGMGVFVIRHHRPKSSYLSSVKLNKCRSLQMPFCCVFTPKGKLQGLRK